VFSPSGIITIIINKVLIKVTLNKVIAGALYIVICVSFSNLYNF